MSKSCAVDISSLDSSSLNNSGTYLEGTGSMHTLELRPWRLVVLFVGVLMITAYLPHPNLNQSLPQTLDGLLKSWTTPAQNS